MFVDGPIRSRYIFLYIERESGDGLKGENILTLIHSQDNPTATLPVQVRRARAWLPCVDTPNAACPFDIRVTVGAHETAVASGELTKQTWASQNRRTFHFTLKHLTPPRHLGLAVGKPPALDLQHWNNICHLSPGIQTLFIAPGLAGRSLGTLCIDIDMHGSFLNIGYVFVPFWTGIHKSTCGRALCCAARADPVSNGQPTAGRGRERGAAGCSPHRRHPLCTREAAPTAGACHQSVSAGVQPL